jgi:uncharacterized protein (DUF2384 family)
MKPMKLTDVRKHTGQRLTYAEAVKLANPGDPFLRNMAVALSLHTWNNTLQDWLRLEAALVIIRHGAAEDAPVSKLEMNLDVDAPDKVAGVLTAAATAYQQSAVELSATWQDRQIPMIWAAIASELDLAAWRIQKIVKQRLDQKRSPIRRKE